MKKRIVAVILAAVALLCSCMSASAEGYKIGYETSFNAETGFVELSLFIDNAVGVQVADLCIGYDEAMYTFDHVDVVATGEAVAGKSQLADGLVTCSLMVMEELGEESVDENGRLSLAVYYFTPVGENYDTEEFFLWAKNFSVNDIDISENVNTQGNPALRDGKNTDVTMPEPDKNEDGSVSDEIISEQDGNAQADDSVVMEEITISDTQEDKTEPSDEKDDDEEKDKPSSGWYIYVIIAAVVVIIGAAVVVVFVVRKNKGNGKVGK